MFVLTLLADTIRIPPNLLAEPTVDSVQTEIEKRCPNKIIHGVGLIICPYGPPLEVGDGMLVPGDGGAHHQVVFQCVVFRPFVEEVLVGTVKESHESGVTVSVGGFFDHVFIPAYWMLNPSKYDERTGLWVWTPKYDDDEGGGDEAGGEGATRAAIKTEEGAEGTAEEADGDGEEGGEEEEDRFDIEIGSEIRFKVKAVNFTRITKTMKGVQATTTTTSHAPARPGFDLNGSKGGGGGAKRPGENGDDDGGKGGGGDEKEEGAVRRRSSSADLSDSAKRPAPMQIVGSICEDGLGLTS
ncbi:hypothetical protein ACHAWF_014660, partial [Thalassiosira exigua]